MEKIMLYNIEAERGRRNLSKSALCRLLEISTKTYLSWIRGDTEIPSSKILQLKKMWSVSADYLLS